ncbi:MAG: hypothetical protein II739_05540, partial [Clostridia bacterium]|nr:hypothetical protein [Clostridia bacterium]
YRGKFGPCVTLSTYDDTFFIYPTEESKDVFNPTKIQFLPDKPMFSQDDLFARRSFRKSLSSQSVSATATR